MLLTAAARRTAARRAEFNSGGFLLTQRIREVPLSGLLYTRYIVIMPPHFKYSSEKLYTTIILDAL
jgi:hypothetical protein